MTECDNGPESDCVINDGARVDVESKRAVCEVVGLNQVFLRRETHPTHMQIPHPYSDGVAAPHFVYRVDF